MSITAAQCRAARGLLAWSQGQLAAAAKVSRATLAEFEAGNRAPYGRTLADIRSALEDAGVTFTNGDEPGVRLRKVHEAGRGSDKEDASDVAIYDDRMADLAAGRDAIVPQEVSDAMMRGASLLKALRKWRGLTQIDLAARTGLGQGYISDLESKRRRGTKETLELIAKALEIEPSWLL
jgi:transcriptional regulator with XRE-family HTH domain